MTCRTSTGHPAGDWRHLPYGCGVPVCLPTVTAEDDGWHYTMRAVDLAEGGYTMDLLRAGVIVRDVPPPLLVNCEVTVTENKYKALFTTLAGSELATMQEDLLPLLMVGHLVRHAKTHACTTGHLRSKNREVWLLISGSIYPLSPPTVLWNKSKGDGMALLRHC